MRRLLSISALVLGLFVVSETVSAISSYAVVYDYRDGSGSTMTIRPETAIPFLGNVSAGLRAPGMCTYNLFGSSWNDCISRVFVSLPTTRCIVLYQHANYSGATYAVHGLGFGRNYNLPSWADNVTSSIRFGRVMQGSCRV